MFLLLHPLVNNSRKKQPDLSIRFWENWVLLKVIWTEVSKVHSNAEWIYWDVYSNILTLPESVYNRVISYISQRLKSKGFCMFLSLHSFTNNKKKELDPSVRFRENWIPLEMMCNRILSEFVHITGKVSCLRLLPWQNFLSRKIILVDM